MTKPFIEEIEFNGIEAFRLHGPKGCRAIVSRFGAQLLSWTTSDGRERLFLSEKAIFDGSVAIRGGIPVCFPQFAGLGPLPKHGFVRTRLWSLKTRRCGEDYALLTLMCADDESSRTLWPHAFQLELTVMIEADRIDLELAITNTGDTDFEFTGALHSYLRTIQVEDVALEGLYGHDYRDALGNDRIIRETGTELIIANEVDRAYLDIKRPQLLRAGNLSMGIQAQGFPDTVVWNPWVVRCAELNDMPPDGWRHMLCIEAAATRPIRVAVGEEWYGRQTLVAV